MGEQAEMTIAAGMDEPTEEEELRQELAILRAHIAKLERELAEARRDRERLLTAAQALGAMPMVECNWRAFRDLGEGYCFCSSERDPLKENHEPECRELRAAINDAEAASWTDADQEGE